MITAWLIGTAMAATPPRAGQAGHIGLGLGTGTNVSGFSVKWLPANDHAFQVLAGVRSWGGRYGGPYGYGALAAELDYLYIMPDIADTDPVLIRWDLGFGGSIVAESNPFFSVQGIAGIEFDFVDVPIDLSLEYRPSIGIFTGGNGYVGFDPFGIGAHVRVWI